MPSAIHRLSIAFLLLGCLSAPVRGANASDGEALLVQAIKAYDEGQYDKAQALAASAGKTAEQSHDLRGQMDALHVQAQAAWKQSRYDIAEGASNLALGLAHDAHDHFAEGRALIDLGDIHERRKKLDQAIAAYQSALGILEFPGDGEQIIRANQQLGDVYVSSGRYEEAFDVYRAALKGAESAGNPAQIALADDYLGYVSRKLGDYVTAASYHHAALKVAASMENPTLRLKAEARANNHLGLCYEATALEAVEAGNVSGARNAYAKAAEYERAALSAALASQDRYRQGYTRRALAFILREASELEDGDARARLLQSSYEAACAALADAVEMKAPEWEGLALHHMAVAKARLGDIDEARALLSRADALWINIEDHYSQGVENLLWAEEIDLPGGQNAAAVSHYDRAIGQFSQIGAFEDVSNAFYRKGLALERAKDIAGAQQAYMASISTLESLRARLSLPEHQQAFFARRQKPYEALIRLLVKRYRQEGSLEDGALAFQISEQARARALTDMIDRNQGQIRAGVDEAARKRERELHSQYLLASQELSASRDPADTARLRETLDRIAKDYLDLENELQRRYPRYAELKHPAPITARDVQRFVLKPREVLIEYFVAEKDTYAFVISRQGLRAILDVPVGRAALASHITALRHPFERVKRTKSISTLEQFDLEKAHDLYTQLFSPLVPYVKAKDKVWIIPHGALFYLPFELLAASTKGSATTPSGRFGRFANVTYLLEVAPPIEYALSASLLDSRLASAIPGGKPRIHFLGFGNPMAQEISPANPSSANAAEADGLRPLEFAEREVDQVKRLYAPRAYAYVGSAATKDQFLVDAPKAGLILLSTHGLLDEAHPMHSALVFAKPAGKNEFALLRTNEIFDLTLHSRLVVLSACEVGLGKILDGEGLIGFDRAFLYAGTSSLVVTLWSVEDQASSRLIVGFFQTLHKRPEKAATALRKTKLSLLHMHHQIGGQTVSLAHPFFWAPFILMGGPAH